jgi:hypothetical protein
MIAIPKPFSTLGSSSEPLYCLKPGLEALWIDLIAGLLVCLSYFKAILIVLEQRYLQTCSLRYNLDQIRF